MIGRDGEIISIFNTVSKALFFSKCNDKSKPKASIQITLDHRTLDVIRWQEKQVYETLVKRTIDEHNKLEKKKKDIIRPWHQKLIWENKHISHTFNKPKLIGHCARI